MAEETRSMARRDFLKAAGVVAGVAIAGPAPAAEAQAEEPSEPTVPKDETPTVSLAATQPPVVGLSFALSFAGALYGYFSEVTGLGSESAVVETKMVDSKGAVFTQKSPGTLKLLDIHLRRGITSSLALWDWRQLVVAGRMGKARKSGSILMFNHNGTPVAQWDFINSWPSRIEAPLPAADAATNALEEIVLVHEGITRVPMAPPPG